MLKLTVSQQLMTTKIMKSFSNETLNIFSTENSGAPTSWILTKLYELCKSCHRYPLETLEQKSFEHWRTICFEYVILLQSFH